MALSSDATSQEFLRICQETMGFLKSYGFSEGKLSIDRADNGFTVAFYGDVLAIECIWDSRDEDLSLKVCRLQDGELPHHYALDDSGRRIRDEVFHLLMERGCRGYKIRKPPQDAKQTQRWCIGMENYAGLLQDYGQVILQQEDIFG